MNTIVVKVEAIRNVGVIIEFANGVRVGLAFGEALQLAQQLQHGLAWPSEKEDFLKTRKHDHD